MSTSQDLRVTLSMKRGGEAFRRVTKVGASSAAIQRKYFSANRFKSFRSTSKVSSQHIPFPFVVPADSFSQVSRTETSSPIALAPFLSSTEHIDLVNAREMQQKQVLASCASSLGLEIDSRGSNENLLGGFCF